jgi:hypothetical protein
MNVGRDNTDNARTARPSPSPFLEICSRLSFPKIAGRTWRYGNMSIGLKNRFRERTLIE